MNVKMLRCLIILLLILCAFYISAVLTGCACHPSSEQLSQLEMTKAAALAAEDQAEAKAQERKKWEAKLQEKQQEKKKAEDDLKAVQEALAREEE